ncbi:MAG TPA: hypothetical protein VJW96_00775 [Terriglobales bacterium]|nr:hypothetical protein [Terriglobales bacterium]
MRNREQKGTIVRISKNWHVRFWERVNVNGTIMRKRKTHLLGPVTTRGKRAPADIETECKAFMATMNGCAIPAENRVSLAQFIETVYLPDIEKYKRPSTFKGYTDVWRYHFRPALQSDLRALKSWRTVDVQNLLDRIAKDAQEPLGRNSQKRIKYTLSAVFGLAKRLGFFDGANPVMDTKISPNATPPRETEAYSLDDVQRFLAVFPEPARTVFAVAAFTGLRCGELLGLEWQDYHDDALWVSRNVWKGHVGSPKTRKAAAPVPVIRQLAECLNMHRLRDMARLHCDTLESGPIFRNSLGGRADSDNMISHQILPALSRCAHCGVIKAKHCTDDHEYGRDARLPEWHGWHPARRGLASNLYALGVSDKIVQAIMRHANVSTTMTYYVKQLDGDVQNAMNAFEKNYTGLTDTFGTPQPEAILKTGTIN